MSFQHGLAGLNAAAANLDVIGNNVANANTVGAKAARAEFADLYANSLTGVTNGGTGIGVTVSNVAQQFTQGDIVSTKNPLDMAINGKGFFRVEHNGGITYTRNGQFRMDKDGFITSAQGSKLTGYAADANGRISNGMPVALKINSGDVPPSATTSGTAQMNLDARAAIPTRPFDAADATSYNNAVSMTIFDSLGREHMMTMYYRKTAENAWDVHAAVDGTALAGTVGQMRFDANGMYDRAASTPVNVTVPVGPEAGGTQPVAVDVSQATQFGSAFGATEVTQNGFSNGRLAGFTIDDNGVIVGRYSNGQTRPQGQIALANFVNPQGLSPLGNNMWSDTASSGQPTIGAPNTGTLGGVESSAVENSNVDLTGELVTMITAQRVYQANAQTIKTNDQMLQTIVNLR